MNHNPLTPRDNPKPGDTYVQSFARGLEVIRSFSASSSEQTLSEVASQTGLTRAGARRILLTLQRLDMWRAMTDFFASRPKFWTSDSPI